MTTKQDRINAFLTARGFDLSMSTRNAKSYTVVDNKTHTDVSTHTTALRAHRKADRLDSVYGACRYIVRINWES